LLPREVLDQEIIRELEASSIVAMDASTDIISRVVLANKEVAESGEWNTVVEKQKDWAISEGRLLYQDRLYVPQKEDLRARLLNEIHRQPSTAHPGRTKMRTLVKERYY
jgi:hypothetical protein